MVNSTQPRAAAVGRVSSAPWTLLLALLLAMLGPARSNARELESETRESAPTTLELEEDLAESGQFAQARRLERHRFRGEMQRLARPTRELPGSHAIDPRPVRVRRQQRRYAIPPPIDALARAVRA